MPLSTLLLQAAQSGASDVHLCSGEPPHVRIDGNLVKLQSPALSAADVAHLAAELLTAEQQAKLSRGEDADLATEVSGVGRLRINISTQANGLSVAVRIIPAHVPTLEQLGLPPVLKQLCHLPHGLVL